jgi:hypothetical protein
MILDPQMKVFVVPIKVELNAHANKLNLQIQLDLSRNRHSPNFRSLYKFFYECDKTMTGLVTGAQFEEAPTRTDCF